MEINKVKVQTAREFYDQQFRKVFGGENMEEIRERKPLPKFSCSVKKGQFNSIEVRVFIPTKYLEKVMATK